MDLESCACGKGVIWQGHCLTCSEPVTVAELERQRYQRQRMTVLRELQKFIREPASAEQEVEQIANREFAPPDLAPHLRD